MAGTEDLQVETEDGVAMMTATPMNGSVEAATLIRKALEERNDMEVSER